jgi:hypothetical protein
MSTESETLAMLRVSHPNANRLVTKMLGIQNGQYDYGLFINLVFEIIDECIEAIQQDRSLRQKHKDVQSEDLITAEIKNMINRTGVFSAKLGEQRSGACDLIITCDSKKFEWSAEAKIHSDYKYLADGFRQITTRYTDGDFNNTNGGFLIYVWNKDVNSVMELWKNFLNSLANEFTNITFDTCPRRPLSFYSWHKHDVSGLDFKVRHMPICLNHEPRDRSARNRKTKI